MPRAIGYFLHSENPSFGSGSSSTKAHLYIMGRTQQQATATAIIAPTQGDVTATSSIIDEASLSLTVLFLETTPEVRAQNTKMRHPTVAPIQRSFQRILE